MHFPKKTSLFLLILGLSYHIAVSQEWNSARISMLYGNSIPFNFNTMVKIKDGVEISNGAKFGITLTDKNVSGHDLDGFVLNFRAFNGQTAINGAVHSLPLNLIRVKAESALGLESGLSYGYTDLSSGWMPLFEYTNSSVWADLNWADHQINVSVECGKPESAGGNGSLLGLPSDYYSVEIEFELVPTGAGF